jgi:hypothetical protein
MIEREEAAFKLLVAHQELAKAIEPAMADLHDPAAGFFARMSLLGPVLLRATGHVSNVAVAVNDLQCGLAAICSVQAQMLGAALGRNLTLDHNGRKNLLQLRDVMPVRPGHDERQGDPTRVDQQVTLAPIFFPDPSGCARSALAPVGP